MAEWMTLSQIADLKLPGLPGDRTAVMRKAQRDGWEKRKRVAAGGGWEYRASSLPKQAQNALAKSLIKAAPAEVPAQLELDLPAAADLKDHQRSRMEARAALLGHIDHLVIMQGISQGQAVKALVEMAEAHDLPPELQKLVPVANARSNAGRSLTRATVYNWLADRAKANGNVVALAPKAAPEADIPAWAATFMRLFCRPSTPGMAECLEQWPIGEEKPSYDQVRRFMKRVDTITKNSGRMGPRALSQLKAYIQRDVSNLWPGAVFLGDGHTFKAEVAHPTHGRPFRPEITVILDVFTRKWVGWSVALAENTWSVADALRHAITSSTCCAIFYYDNGSGAKNTTWDNELVGLAARLAITKFHSAPWSSQARGVVERFNSTVLHKLARRFPTYLGQRMDKEAGQKVFKITRADIKKYGTSRLLPSWGDLRAYLDEVMAQYNARPHSELPRTIDPVTGKRRTMSPDERWAQAIAEGWQPDPISEAEAVDLFRPAEVRTTNRGIVQLFNNDYFHDALVALGGEDVSVSYDIHDASRVWVRMLDGRFVCEAVWNANRRDYLPVSFAQAAEEKRVAGKLARLEAHRDTALAELRPGAMIQHQRQPVATPISEAEAAALAAIEAELNVPAQVPQPGNMMVETTEDASQQPILDTVEGRFKRLLEIEARQVAGQPVSDVDRAWAKRQAALPDIRATRLMYDDFGDAVLTA